MKLIHRVWMVGCCALMLAAPALADGKLGVFGLYMAPNGKDAEDYGEAAGGIGLHAMVPLKLLPSQLLAVSGGLEFVNLMSKEQELRDRTTGLLVIQKTNQYYYRFTIGPEFGGHGRGFLQPHIGANLAFILYGYSIDLVVPDDTDAEKEIKQTVDDDTNLALGEDITLGLDLRLSRVIYLDGGVRYLKSFNLPQEFGREWRKISPEYMQIYFGIGLNGAGLQSLAESGIGEQ